MTFIFTADKVFWYSGIFNAHWKIQLVKTSKSGHMPIIQNLMEAKYSRFKSTQWSNSSNIQNHFMEMPSKWFLPFSQHACGSVGVSKPMVFQRFRRYLKLRISLLSLSRVAFIILADILSSLVIFISLMWCILINNREVLVSNLRLGCSQGLLLSYMGIKWAVNALDPIRSRPFEFAWTRER